MASNQQPIESFITVLRQLAGKRESKKMNARDLMYWLQGEFEMNGAKGMTASSVAMIRDHVALAIAEEVRLDRMREMQVETALLEAKARLGVNDGHHSQRQYGPPAGC